MRREVKSDKGTADIAKGLSCRIKRLELMIETCYDFENRVSLIDKFRSAS